MSAGEGSVANVENVEDNVVEITTMTPEQVVMHWAQSNKISADAVEKLFEEGFTSLEAINLLDSDDLSKSKIPRGQKKLILSCVQSLNGGEDAGNKAPLLQVVPPPHAQTENRDSQTSATNEMPNQSAIPSESQDGGFQATQKQCDSYLQGLLNQLCKGQIQARNGFPSELSVNTRQQTLSDTQANVLSSANTANLAQSVPQSWKDPKIYLASAATGKSASTHYDIVDFVCGNAEEEIVVGGTGSHQVVLKAGPKKPKLETVSLSQWTIANLAILYKLHGESRLTGEGMLDYLSYTTKICQLVQRYNLVSVLLYDREYRKLQCAHDFRWGTDVPHLHSICNPAYPAQMVCPKAPVSWLPTHPGWQSHLQAL